MIKSITIGFLSSKSLANRESGRQFLESLPEQLRPLKFNDHEPINKPFSAQTLDECLSLWANGGLLWRARPTKTSGHFITPARNSPQHDAVIISTTAKVLRSLDAGKLMHSFHELFGLDFGYVQVNVSGDLDDIGYYRSHIEIFSQGFCSTRDLLNGLPNLPWAVVLGPPYREIFGDRLEIAPAFNVRDLGEGATYLQLTEDISDVDRKLDAVRAAREAVQAHLGCNAFRDGGVPPLTVPEFFPVIH